MDERVTKKLAELACVDLTENEAIEFAAQIGEVLKYVEQMGLVDVEGLEPLINPGNPDGKLRADTPGDSTHSMLENAPDVLNDSFKVPPIL